jgi:HK97 family phage prohead protease
MKIPKLVECKSVPCHLPEEVAREVDEVVATLPKDKAFGFRRKSLGGEVTDTDPTERTDISYVSTPAVDRDREIVLPSGIDLSQYEKNRIVLYQHRQDDPVGKCLWIKPDNRGVIAKTFYPPRPDKYEGDWLSEKVWGLVASGVLKGKSVGMLPTEVSDPTPDQREKGCEVVISKALLLEYSVVAIPSCPDSLVTAISKGLPLDILDLNWKWTGQKVRARTKRTVTLDRRPQLTQALAGVTFDPDAIVERVLEQLRQRGRA